MSSINDENDVELVKIRNERLNESLQRKYKYLLIDINKQTGIALVTINRPEVFNALNLDAHLEMANVFKDLDLNPFVKVIVITGAGKAFYDAIFCAKVGKRKMKINSKMMIIGAGGDLQMVEKMTQNEAYHRQVHEDAQALVQNILQTKKIIITAINGVAVGAGAVVAILSDISIAHAKATLSDGHINIGVAAGDHACYFWPLAMGIAKAKYYLLTGLPISAAEAEKAGLISRVVDKPEDVLPEAMQVAAKIASGPTYAIRHTKYALNQYLKKAAIESGDLSMALEMINFKDGDAAEGIRALREKRKASFPSAKSKI